MSGSREFQRERLRSLRDPEYIEVLSKVRRLLRFAGKKVEAGRGHTKSLRKQRLSQLEHWKQLFLKFDKLHSGHLTIKQFSTLVRCKLKLPQRVLTNEDLDALIQDLDLDGDGDISFAEFVRFIEEEDDDDLLDPACAKSVGRALRLALRRKHLQLEEIHEQFDLPLDDDGLVRFADLVDLFRHDLGMTRHECSDKSILKAFHSLGTGSAHRLTKDDAMEFVRALWQVGDGLSNLDGDSQTLQSSGEHMSHFWRESCSRQLSRQGSRPGTTSGRETLPFRSTGRERAPSDRLTASSPTVISRPASQAALSRPMTTLSTSVSTTLSDQSGLLPRASFSFSGDPAAAARPMSVQGCMTTASQGRRTTLNRSSVAGMQAQPAASVGPPIPFVVMRSESTLPSPVPGKPPPRASLLHLQERTTSLEMPLPSPKSMETGRSMTPSLRSPPSSSPRPGSSASQLGSSPLQKLHSHNRSDRYFWLRGGQALNRVEQMMQEVGVHIKGPDPAQQAQSKAADEELLRPSWQTPVKLSGKLPQKINRMLLEEFNKDVPRSLSDALELGDALELSLEH